MLKPQRIIFLLAIFVSFAAHAEEKAMYLCRSPLIAHGFWADLSNAQQLGVQVDKKVAKEVAAKNDCIGVVSDHLKPVQAGWAGMLKLSDGKHSGWVAPEYFVIYVNSDKNQ